MTVLEYARLCEKYHVTRLRSESCEVLDTAPRATKGATHVPSDDGGSAEGADGVTRLLAKLPYPIDTLRSVCMVEVDVFIEPLVEYVLYSHRKGIIEIISLLSG